MRGWANYFRHAVCKHTLDALNDFRHRVIRWQMKLHRWGSKDVRRRLTGSGGRWRRPLRVRTWRLNATSAWSVSLSPDGRTLAFVDTVVYGGDGTVRTMPADAPPVRSREWRARCCPTGSA